MIPPEDSDLKIHKSLLDRDPTAPASVAETYLDYMIRTLRLKFRECTDDTLIQDAATDAILNYIQHPETFKPGQSKLSTYLIMSARGDLLNALGKDKRRKDREEFMASPVELPTLPGNNIQEDDKADLLSGIPSESDNRGMGALNEMAEELFPDPVDREVLRLITEGERSTAAFAKVLGITNMREQEQKETVKRHKDRIKKRLERLGKRLKTNG
jgi:RNA polymerase sigma-70 factor (ECF subfamily)